MNIVTAGSPYLDIDAYAGCIAYSELLNLQGYKSVPVSSATMNISINETIKSWNTSIQTNLTPHLENRFIIIDVSDPKYFDTIVNPQQIVEIIDHHLGFEGFWANQSGVRTQIEFVGSVCTMIYERWQSHNLVDKISQTSARLLLCGILDNTLNFKAKVTHERDTKAYQTLLAYANLPNNWTDTYFSECQSAIESQLTKAIQYDTKNLSLKSYPKVLHMGQLTVWNAEKLIRSNEEVIISILKNRADNWLMNVISINEGKSYFITDNEKIKSWISELINVRFHKNIGVADRLWLRKEVIKEDLSS